MGTIAWPWHYFRQRRERATAPAGNGDEAVDEILASLSSIDRDEFRRSFPGSPRLKYLHFERFVGRDVAYCRLLGLDRMPPARILDIGCGTGLFLYSARYFGHAGVGIDVENDFYRRIAAELNVDRRIEPVTPFLPLHIDGPFQLVTAIATTFDRYYTEEDRVERLSGMWGASEWLFFLKDIQRLLTPAGRFFLKLNKSRHEDRPNAALAPGRRDTSGRSLLYDQLTLSQAIEKLSREAAPASVAESRRRGV